MKKLLGVIGLALIMAAPAFAGATYAPQVIGKRARKYIRHYLYIENLSGDKRAVFDEYGYTPHRLRLDEYGQIRERWTYLEQGLVFEFDECGHLVDTHATSTEFRRSWAFQRDVCSYDEDVPSDD